MIFKESNANTNFALHDHTHTINDINGLSELVSSGGFEIVTIDRTGQTNRDVNLNAEVGKLYILKNTNWIYLSLPTTLTNITSSFLIKILNDREDDEGAIIKSVENRIDNSLLPITANLNVISSLDPFDSTLYNGSIITFDYLGDIGDAGVNRNLDWEVSYIIPAFAPRLIDN